MSSKGFYREDAKGLGIQQLSLRPREAAEALGISISTLERLTRSGEIPCVKANRVVLYDVVALKAWLDAKQLSQSAKSGTLLILDARKSVFWGLGPKTGREERTPSVTADIA